MHVIAIDLGGTKVAAALFDKEGEKLFSSVDTLDDRKGIEVAELVLAQIFTVLQHAKENLISVASLGICVPGIYYSRTGSVWAPNIKDWENFPLLDYLRENLVSENLEIKIDSDRACYILGEAWKGNARGCSDAIFLAVGTGIGAGIMVSNEVLRGANDIAGAIGWMALDRPFDKKYISCGCFEYNASGEGVRKVASDFLLVKKFEPGLLTDKDSITGAAVFEAYEKSDKLAESVINNAIECWGMAVANLVSLFNPQKIIFGGGVFGPGLKFLDEIYEEAKKWAQPISIKQVKLEASALGADAGLYGAGYLTLK